MEAARADECENPVYRYSERDRYAQLVGEQDFHERIARTKGDAFREYRALWDSAGRFEVETPVPLHLDFQLSTRCNFKCRMCPFGMPREQRPFTFDAVKGNFPLGLFKKVIDEGAAAGLKAIDLSYYNEPLLRRSLPEFIEYAAKRGVLDIMLSTNAQLLTPGLTERLLDAGLTRFMVSVDATTAATYSRIRIGGDFHKVVNNLKYFLARKRDRNQELPVTRVSFLKTKINEHELDDFITEWKPLVDYLSIQELNRFEGLTNELTATTRVRNPDFRCHQPWHRMVLRANGDAIPCCTTWGQRLVMGNVRSQSLVQIWNSRAFQSLRLLHKEKRYQSHPICRRCAENFVED